MSRRFIIWFFLSPFSLVGLSGEVENWEFSEENLVAFKSNLELLESTIKQDGISDELKPIFLQINEYGFQNWLSSGQVPESKTRAVVSRYNEIWIEMTLSDDIRSGVIKNAVSRLLSATQPDTLTRNNLEQLTDYGKSKSDVYYTLQSLGLYDGYVEQMVTEAFNEAPQDRMGLAISLGLEAAAPHMLEAVSKPFDPKSLEPQSSTITTLDSEGNVVQKERTVYEFLPNQSARNIERAARWLSANGNPHPEIRNQLRQRLSEIEAYLPDGAMPQFRGLLLGASRPIGAAPTREKEESRLADMSINPENPELEREPPQLESEESPRPTPVKITEEPVAEEPAPIWPWILGTLILIGGLGLILSRKKSSPNSDS